MVRDGNVRGGTHDDAAVPSPTDGRSLGEGSEHDPTPRPQVSPVLQARFRLNEIDRTSSSLRFRLTYLRWLILPVLGIALGAMVIGLVLGAGSPGPVVGGIAGVVAAAVGFLRKAGDIQDDLSDLQAERRPLLAGMESESGSESNPVSGPPEVTLIRKSRGT